MQIGQEKANTTIDSLVLLIDAAIDSKLRLILQFLGIAFVLHTHTGAA